MRLNQKKDPVYTILLIGDTLVGKTSIIHQYCDGIFKDGSNISTIGCDVRTKDIPLESSIAKLKIWDTAGQEKFKSMTKNMFKGADAFILVYDITNESTFKNVNHWINDIKENAQEKSRLILIGNKMDLKNERVISKEKGRQLAMQFKVQFIETSCKTNENINDVFNKIAKEIDEYHRTHNLLDVSQENIPSLAPNVTKKKSCCNS